MAAGEPMTKNRWIETNARLQLPELATLVGEADDIVKKACDYAQYRTNDPALVASVARLTTGACEE